MRLKKIKKPAQSFRPRSKELQAFLELKKGSDECLFFSDEDDMRRTLTNLCSFCRRHESDFRPTSRSLEDGWAIWKT